MDPISIIVEIEIATLVLAGVGAFATWLHHKSHERAHRQRERHHREMKALHKHQHDERRHAGKGRTKKRVKPVQPTKML